MNYLFIILFFFLTSVSAIAEDIKESVCFGRPGKGRIENAWQLPRSGNNFSVYSAAGAALGRNYVHSKVYRTVIDAYKDLEERNPGAKFIYGEASTKEGGKFPPHKSHQNGLSVDFFVPVKDISGTLRLLPIGPPNRHGYAIEFDSHGNYKEFSIDFETMADHLFALKKAADKNGIKIRRVIFDNDFQKLLFNTTKGKELKSLIAFYKKKSWVRHDEHYHIDFQVPCNEFR